MVPTKANILCVLMGTILTATVIACATLALAGVSTGLKISNVTTDRQIFRPDRGDSVAIVYNLSMPAAVDVNIYDSRDILIRRVVAAAKRNAGDHREIWDGKDDAGKLVPPEAYVYTIRARNDRGDSVIYDVTDKTGGEQQWALDLKYDAKARAITYVLPKPGRITIRLGLKVGPLLRTLVDWSVRDAGLHREPWDGFDNSGVLQFNKHPGLEISFWGYVLNQNSIIVAGDAWGARPEFVRDIKWGTEKRESTRPKVPKLFDFWNYPRESCRDPKIYLKPLAVEAFKDNVPVISGDTYFQMSIDPGDQKLITDQKFEVVFYVDGVFIYEEEVGYAPFAWRWRPVGVNTGEHFITAMLRGYKGNFGSATTKVWVGRERE
jgi:hypothetical protein